MTWIEALEIVVARTKHARYRVLCDASHPDHERHRATVLQLAGQPPAYPPVIQQAANFAGAMGRSAAAAITGQPTEVDEPEQNRRMLICRSCDQYDAEQSRCYLCGCPAALKARRATEHCPISKW